MDESDLTGESNLVMKTPIPFDDSLFNYSRKKSFLFLGTNINKCESKDSVGKIKALALNTGYNTLRGNLIQNLLFPKSTKFSIFGELKYYILIMIIIYLLKFGITYYFYFHRITKKDCGSLGNNGPCYWKIEDLIMTFIKNLTVILPPTLPISLTFTSFYFHFNLKRKMISCISEKRMIAAGKVKIMVIDKTGTLTEEGLDLHGFQISKISVEINKVLCFDVVERQTDVFNLVHREFWKSFSKDPDSEFFIDYQFNLQNNIVYYLECLATCHTIDKIKGELLGNSVDKRIFDVIGWNIENSSDDNTNVFHY